MLKSIFIMAYLTVAGFCTVQGIAGIVEGTSLLASIGLVLVAAPIFSFVAYIMVVKGTARTSAVMMPALVLAVVGTGLTIQQYVTKGTGTNEMAYAILMLALYLLYEFWFSRLDRSSSKLAVGKGLPKFELQDNEGNIFNSEKLQGGPAILIFFRGNWCPLCVAQIKEIAAQYRTLTDAGVRTVFVSPQSDKHMRSLANRFDAPLEFLRDAGNKVARQLGIAQNHGIPMGMQALGYESETVLPTVIITDAKGRVVWLHETDNYRVRPEPETYFQVLKANRLIKV